MSAARRGALILALTLPIATITGVVVARHERADSGVHYPKVPAWIHQVTDTQPPNIHEQIVGGHDVWIDTVEQYVYVHDCNVGRELTKLGGLMGPQGEGAVGFGYACQTGQ